jgi:uncharacterized protein (TIGR02391 family)
MATSNSPTRGHPKFPQARRPDYDGSGLMARRAAAFPRAMLHPRIAELVWGDLAAGNYDQAVFKAFREVEIAVRDAGNFEPNLRAVHVMRLAFGPQGALADPDGVPSEVEALRELFSGAIGSYKNPHSHRTVNIQEVAEAYPSGQPILNRPDA